MTSTTIRDARPEDVAAITEIQNALLATDAIEWTETPHTVEEKLRWLEAHDGAGHPVLVAVELDDDGTEQPDGVVGWAAFGDFRDIDRWPGYRFTVEHTVHVRRSHAGSGIGRALMTELIERARLAGKHVLVAAVDADNEGSIRFHEQLGFVEVARMPEVGAKFGRWLGLVLLQLRLDERATPPG